jgi:arylsulfatase A-like enzyme
MLRQIQVSYTKPFPGELTVAAARRSGALKLEPSHGHHDMAVVNGVPRIGFSSGGTAAQWTDEDMADVFTRRAVGWMDRAKGPFFLYFATHGIHVPRMPHKRFSGKSPMGARGDALLEFDWTIGQLAASLEKKDLAKNPRVIVTSDNGPILNDVYKDNAVEFLGNWPALGFGQQPAADG